MNPPLPPLTKGGEQQPSQIPPLSREVRRDSLTKLLINPPLLHTLQKGVNSNQVRFPPYQEGLGGIP
jgi:hypothetical protein